MNGMYARKEPDGSYTMRQARYADMLTKGKEHPHDVCAMARSVNELHAMCEHIWPDADYSNV